MLTVATSTVSDKDSFQTVLAPFLQDPGLPFANILAAQDMQRAFAEQDGLFAQEDIYSTAIVLWAFLAQVLRDGKGAACAAAVADIALYCHQRNRPVPCGDTGDYCRARAKLDPKALRQLVGQVAEDLEDPAHGSWLWHGMHAKLVDGFTFTMADTEDNQTTFPQPSSQKTGVGQPIARACAILSLATAAIHDIAVGPYEGKETGETALLRSLLDAFPPGDLVIFDRYYCSYMMLALLIRQGIQVCTRLHQLRPIDFRQGRRLGEDDHLVTWTRPARPEWMSETLYVQIPETLTLRELRFSVTEPGYRPQDITVITTLTDPVLYPKQDVADLFGLRWNVELDIETIKKTLNLDYVPCKSPAMVLIHLWVTLLAYNLIRGLIATAAAKHDKQPRQIGFTHACQTVLSAWMDLSTGTCRHPHQFWEHALERIAAHKVAHRPGRIEPRVIKRRLQRYPFMQKPRSTLKAKLLRKPTACDTA